MTRVMGRSHPSRSSPNATKPLLGRDFVERTTGFEPATLTLAR